ncbi:hypothetical protein U1R68_07325 [Pectobacterium colocasium]
MNFDTQVDIVTDRFPIEADALNGFADLFGVGDEVGGASRDSSRKGVR